MPEDFIKIFHSTSPSSSIYYAVIGIGLGVGMTDLVELSQSSYMPSINKLYLVFQKWRDLSKDFTWEKVLTVCEDYSFILQDAKANLIRFLSNTEADNNQIFSSEEEQMIHEDITDKELLKKEPLHGDLIRVIHSTSQASFHYAVIGVGLGINVGELIASSEIPLVNKLIIVFQKWRDSNNNVTWGKILKVCADYPNELGNAGDNIIQFLLSSEEQQMIYESINKELLEKEPLLEDLMPIIHSTSQASFHYAVIGVGLGINVGELIASSEIPLVNKLIIVFQKWRDSNNNVTWGKILKVCADYPNELGNAGDNIIQFLLSSEEQQMIYESINKELLEKEPLLEDLMPIIHSTSQASLHYAIIGVGLGVDLKDIIQNPNVADNLGLVFHRWNNSNNNVTWGKILKVCEDYNELGKAKKELIKFLSSEQARKYLQPIYIKTPDAGEPIHIEVPDPIAREEHPILAQEGVEGSHTMLYSLYVWSEGIVPILIAVLTVIIILIVFIYNLRQNN